MTVVNYKLWDSAPLGGDYEPYILHYQPDEVKTDAAVYLVPGSGYVNNPAIPTQEGDNVARYLAEQGITVFICIYRVGKDGCFPQPTLDGRRGMRWVRYNAEKFGIDPKKIISLGYSAGGHLCASLVSVRDKLEGEGVDEIDDLDYVPDYQALCYPVISFDTSKKYTHAGSCWHLLGEAHKDLIPAMCFENTVVAPVPPTFLFHNFDDAAVGVENSLLYAARLRELGISVEMHVYPHGGHGVGIGRDDSKANNHNGDWVVRFVEWIKYNGLL
jgi:acetyl esterase/lipase